MVCRKNRAHRLLMHGPQAKNGLHIFFKHCKIKNKEKYAAMIICGPPSLKYSQSGPLQKSLQNLCFKEVVSRIFEHVLCAKEPQR